MFSYLAIPNPHSRAKTSCASPGSRQKEIVEEGRAIIHTGVSPSAPVAEGGKCALTGQGRKGLKSGWG